MQQLKVQHENTTKKCKREGKGRVLAISRRIYRLQKTDVFYVESESSDNTYYFVKYNLQFCIDVVVVITYKRYEMQAYMEYRICNQIRYIERH